MKKAFILSAILFFGFFGSEKVLARDDVADWYVKNFDSKIIVNKDSSLDITETILADCGKALGKHGIFRVLPEEIKLENGGTIKNPIKLISITDASGKEYEYAESANSSDKTITWKIGSADKTVQGENTYIIHYQVKNAIRFGNEKFDELYWNLTGNFWDLEIDQAHIELVFPEEVTQKNSDLYLYSGSTGTKNNLFSQFAWKKENILEINSIGMLPKKQGITLSLAFPKDIFTPYVPTFWEKYGRYIFLLIPVFVLITCFRLWQKYGKDPKEKETIIAHYAPPLGLSPLALGMLEKNGRMDNKFITAEIVNLAVKGLLSIKEVQKKVLFFDTKDYELILLNNPAVENSLTTSQKIILSGIFMGKQTILLSSLKNRFYTVLSEVKKETDNFLEQQGLIVKSGMTFGTTFLVIGMMMIFLSFWSIGFSIYLFLALMASGVIVVAFSFIMPKRTVAGTEANWQLKGFKLFMQTVDKDRAKFYEKENIFEECLPYAILFGMTEEWIKRIKDIYGEEYLASHAPLWYAGAALTSFDANNFVSAMNNLSSDIAANTSSPSGSGGSGGSGGGGGGGGGGGW